MSIYRKYSKWNGSAWINDGSYHQISPSGAESNVADVRLFLCEVGVPSGCKAFF
ncbi:hypothetical protein [Streptomyces laurentii]|uniref:hypothetical protein n=1 Tax=Streptomyces laurentii TaxID=39478 RepID=UPI0033CC4CC6